jgi:prolipoprotein diacylglyceryl transferase
VLDFAFFALLGGLVGARIVFIIVNWNDYVSHPMTTIKAMPVSTAAFWAAALLAVVGLMWRGNSKVTGGFLAAAALAFVSSKFLGDRMVGPLPIPKLLAIWEGGLVFYGSALGGFLAFLWYARKRGWTLIDRLHFADMVVIGVPLAQIFGRMGCMAAGCCWGDHAYHFDGAAAIADFPLTFEFPKQALAYQSLLASETGPVVDFMKQSGHTVPLYPVQLMEAFGNSLIVMLLLFIRSRKWFHGQVLISYGILYPILRAIMELFRGDTARGYVIPGVLSTSQFISLLVATASVIAIFVLRNRSMKQAPSVAP